MAGEVRQAARSALGGMILAVTLVTPAAAQQSTPAAQAKPKVPVLNNASIGKPVPLHQRHTLSSEEWEHFVAHQYVAVATPTPYERWRAESGPHVVVIPDSTPQPYIPPSYPLTGSYYAPFYFSPPIYPGIYPGWNSSIGDGNGGRHWSDHVPHPAPPIHLPQPPQQPPPGMVQAPPKSAPAVSVGMPAPRGR